MYRLYFILTSNIGTALGLSNGTMGTIVDIIFDSNDPNSIPGFLPTLIWIDISNNQYRGETFFPNDTSRSNWVPISSVKGRKNYFSDGLKKPCVRTMFPIKLCYAFTPWKVQGQTLRNKFVANLGTIEKADGLAYVIFSRARRLQDIGLEGGFNCDRLIECINKRESFKRRLKF